MRSIERKEMRYTKKQIEEMDKTERPWKSTVAHKWLRFLCSNKKAKILDFGCGKRKTMPQVLRDQGYKNIVGYDIMFERHQTKGDDHYETFEKINQDQLWNYIVVSNVLNIQPTEEHIYSTLETINSIVKPKTTVIINYPLSPRRLPEITNALFRDMIEDVFLANPKHKVQCTFGSHGIIALIKGK